MKLITTCVKSQSDKRNKELEYCFEDNSKHPLIDDIYLMTEDPSAELFAKSPKVTFVQCEQRVTFEMIIELCSKFKDDTAVVIANADIVFDETLNYVQFEDSKLAYCLTRSEQSLDINNPNKSEMTPWNVSVSFDTWILKTPIPKVSNIDFGMGVPGCDNRFSYELFASGLHPINPSRLIRTYHVHLSAVRTYKELDRLSGSYLNIKPTESLVYSKTKLSFDK
jgi:Fe-S cluster assembly iron-binding protein IscA